MKKLFFTLLTLCLCGATYAADFSAENTDGTTIYYNILTGVEGNQVEVTYTGSSQPSAATSNDYTGSITIPSTVTNGDTTYNVTSIGNYAFSRSSITSVDIPSSITSIGNSAFYYCSSLTGPIIIPDDVTTINVSTFGNCTKLTGVTLPSTVTSIGASAFITCSALTSINLPSGLTSIGNSAFRACSKLAIDLTIPEGVTTIEDETFYGCSALTGITLPSLLTSIGELAFYNCNGLTELTIPATVKTYGVEAFYSCSNLKTIILLDTDPSDVTFNGTAGSTENSSGDVFRSDSGITFYVPRGSEAAYEASYWETEAETDGDSFNFFSINLEAQYTDGSSYYATYYMDDENYEVPTTSTIYAVTSVEDGVATMDALSGDIIPSGTPLLIKSSASGTYYFWKDYYGADGTQAGYLSGTTPTTIEVPTGNMLYGHSEAGLVSEPTGNYLYYKLSLDSSGSENSIGFYYGAEGGVAYEAGAHKCWLAVPSDSGNPSGISLKKDEGDDTTGISSIESASEAKVSGIYTIQGVRVSNMNQPGLYIVDGKKVLVK